MGVLDKYLGPVKGSPQPTPAPAKKPGLFDRIAKVAQNVQDFAVGAAKGAVSTVKNTADLGNRGLELITGAPHQDVTSIIPKSTYTTKNAAEKAGFGTEQIAEFFAPTGVIGKAGKAVESAVESAKLGKFESAAAKILGKATVSGGLTGAIRAGQTNSVKEGLETGAIVGAGDAVLGAAGEVFKAAKSALSARTTKQLESTYDELLTGTKSAKNVSSKSAAAGKSPAAFLAKNGYVVDVANGKIDAAPVIQQIRKNTEPYQEVLTNILREKDRTLPTSHYVNLDDLAVQAKRSLNTATSRGSGTLADQYKAVDQLIADLKVTYGQDVNLSTLDEIKKGQWASSHSFDLSRPKFMADVNYAVGSAAKNRIEKGVTETSVKELNSLIGDHMDAINNLKKVDGSAVKGGRLGRYFARIIGGGVGSHLGPLGTAGGAYAGDVISQLLQDTSIAGPFKRQILESIPKDNALFEQAQAALQKMKLSQPLLPAHVPGTPDVSNNIPIQLPAKIHPLEDTLNMVRSRIIRPTGTSTRRNITQIFPR